jgi:hypothetical protein
MRGLMALGLLVAAMPVMAQDGYPPPVTFTQEQDHRNMREQLGITEMQVAPNADPASPNVANFFEEKAGPVRGLPELLVTNDGRKVTTADMWWKVRRPEIAEAFEREVYGRIPANVPKVTWKVVAQEREMMGFPRKAVIARQVIGHVDNSSYPLIDVNIRMVVVTPADAKGPVPLLVMYGRDEFPAPTLPTRAEYEKIDTALKGLLTERDPSLVQVFKDHPAFNLFQEPGRTPRPDETPKTEQIIAAGWGYALLDATSIQADNAPGLTRGIIGLVNKGQPRKPEDWGALRAWGWGAGRAIDYLETDPTVDAKRIGIDGVSRYGKGAIVTAAFEPRFAMALVASSGKGGAALFRRHFGQEVINLAGPEYWWMGGNFLKYGAAKSKFGAKGPYDLPVDSHQLMAMIAPRLLFVSYGTVAGGDGPWQDQKGSFMATIAAGPVFRLLGVGDLGVGDDWRDPVVPAADVGLLDGNIAWRMHSGGHTDVPNIETFIEWSNRRLDATLPRR